MASNPPPRPPCELCHSRANIFCASDNARLCWSCDSHVHGANFLVARHSRTFLCHSCASLTSCSKSGSCLHPEAHFCGQCPSSCGSCSRCTEGSGNSDDEGSGVTQCSPTFSSAAMSHIGAERHAWCKAADVRHFRRLASQPAPHAGSCYVGEDSDLDEEVSSGCT